MTYLITGGSGTFGSAFIQAVLREGATRVISVATGEHRHAALAQRINDARLECWTGNVRDAERMREVMGVKPDVVIHAAAMKRIESCERDAEEAHKTNVLGTLNVVKAAMLADVPKVLVISSDKACSPETVYGATKAEAEALAIARNGLRGKGRTRISAVRYGNVLGSNGSFLDVLLRARQTQEPIAITDPEATRFWWSVDDAVAFVLRVLDRMQGAEIWIPSLASARVVDLAHAIAPKSQLTITGMRGPEKVHEAMINPTEARYAYRVPEGFLLLPKRGQWWSPDPPADAVAVPPSFVYTSNDDPLPVSLEGLEPQCALPS